MTNKFTLDKDELKVYRSIMYYRLKKDLQYTEEQIERNKVEKPGEDKNIVLKYADKFKGNIVDSFISNKESILEQIANYESRYKSFYNEEELPKYIAKMLKGDKYQVNLNIFSLTILSDKEVEFVNESSTLADVSKMLYNDSNFLKELNSEFKKVYKEVVGNNLTSFQKGTLGAASLVALFAMIPGGVLAFLRVGALIGASYVLMKSYNISQIKDDIKKLNYEEVAYLLSLKFVLFNKAKEFMTEKEIKENLNEMLSFTSDLKSDSLYCLLVEKVDIEKNKKLTDAYYRFDQRLIKTLLPKENKSFIM